MSVRIPFNKPYSTGRELANIERAMNAAHLSCDGDFTRLCEHWLSDRAHTKRAFLTHSCSAALEMSAILLEVGPGDEVILPSFTFVSTANAFVARGATPVFVDIRPDTLNIDESKIVDAISAKTRAICIVHYAGVACEMSGIMSIARDRDLPVVEDAAQGLMASYRGQPLGSFGQLGALSFHETKNVTSGQGGALLVNAIGLEERAQVMRDKGTNRAAFLRGDVNQYTWTDIGSSYSASELAAAFLWAQLEAADGIMDVRHRIWNRYFEGFADAERRGCLRRPVVPAECRHNAHLFYLLFPNSGHRAHVMRRLHEAGIEAVFHYIPLHSSPAGRKFARTSGELDRTDHVAATLLRLPIYVGLDDAEVDEVIGRVLRAIEEV